MVGAIYSGFCLSSWREDVYVGTSLWPADVKLFAGRGGMPGRAYSIFALRISILAAAVACSCGLTDSDSGSSTQMPCNQLLSSGVFS